MEQPGGVRVSFAYAYLLQTAYVRHPRHSHARKHMSETTTNFMDKCKQEMSEGRVLHAAETCDVAQTSERVLYYANLPYVREVDAKRKKVKAMLRDMEYHHTGWSWVHTDGCMSLFSQNDSKVRLHTHMRTFRFLHACAWVRNMRTCARVCGVCAAGVCVRRDHTGAPIRAHVPPQ